MIVCEKCRSLDLVTIPRARYDALMAAAEALSEINTTPKWWKMQTEALDALRAAGVEMGEP